MIGQNVFFIPIAVGNGDFDGNMFFQIKLRMGLNGLLIGFPECLCHFG